MAETKSDRGRKPMTEVELSRWWTAQLEALEELGEDPRRAARQMVITGAWRLSDRVGFAEAGRMLVDFGKVFVRCAALVSAELDMVLKSGRRS